MAIWVLCLILFIRLLLSGDQAVAIEKCGSSSPHCGFSAGTKTTAADELRSGVPDSSSPAVVRLARSVAVCPAGHDHALATGALSQILGALIQPASPRGRPTCHS